MLLYPRLPGTTAGALASMLRHVTVEAAATVAALEHLEAVYTPTGGTRVSPAQLSTLRTTLLGLAVDAGYPATSSEDQRLHFDMQAAVALHTKLQIAPGEASKPGVWTFFSCVLLPDLVRWRFPGTVEGTSLDRFQAGRRNTFQRLWWRAHLLYDPARTDHPYANLQHLGEDEIVQIMERPNLAGSRRLTHQVARELISAAERHPEIARRDLIREAQKRLLRLSAFISFDSLDPDEVAASVHAVFEAVAGAVH